MKKIGAVTLVAGTVLAASLAGAGVASAEEKRGTKCLTPTKECKLASGFFPGGQIHVDIDAIGQNYYFTWTLGNCKGGAYVADPPRSFTCTLPASFYTLTGRNEPFTVQWEMGLRWG
ncbi:hypothetical protein ACFWMR_16325 [Amycolatopsis thailandensis]|uniref:Ig-like domain-containing protein n=1 Tax=Amycolatopsis thailandensis TaxID=589330 RepID=A0A229RHF9_9PSEU|nr:hypothetical protein [Amycolatopsis thailandensis]OXM45919.1 hypothetical protein CFP71_37665 [Amycolatopsis thailandensis]